MKGMTMPLSVIYETNQTGSVAGSSRKVWTFAAVVSAFFGATACFAGVFFMILAFFEPSLMHSRLGGWLLISVFPLFILAAHSLDKIELAERAEKIAKLKNYREKVISRQNFK